MIKRNKIKRIRYIDIDYSQCKGCSICIEMCERHVFNLIHIGQGINKSHPKEVNCEGCGYCELFCPDRAIYVDGAYRCNDEVGL